MTRPFDCISDFMFFGDQLEKADIILVPGCFRPHLILKAVELYKQGLAPLILPSGGVGHKLGLKIAAGEVSWQSEWEYLQSIALENGVPAEAILKEDQALHTFDNAQLSRQLVDKLGIKVKKAILVCKAHHARRALLTYQAALSKDVEYFVCSVIDDRDVRVDNWFTTEKKIGMVMSELEKIGKYFGKHIPNLRNE